MAMRSTSKRAASPGKAKAPVASIDTQIESAVAWLRSHATTDTLDGMARYAIPSTHALGVSVGDIRMLAKRLGRKHELALALWETGIYEARTLAAFVDEPALVTPAQMDRWCREFDNWGICDTLCFHLFDKTPHAWAKVAKWADSEEEFVKRAAFALLASVALHDKKAPDTPFLESLPLIERGATDERNFVKKGVSWALRGIGKRNAVLHGSAGDLARRLAASPHPAARWVGKDALRALASPATAERLAVKRAPTSRCGAQSSLGGGHRPSSDPIPSSTAIVSATAPTATSTRSAAIPATTATLPRFVAAGAARCRSSRSVLRRLARQPTSNRSPSRGTLPMTPSTAMLATIRMSTGVGAPIRADARTM